MEDFGGMGRRVGRMDEGDIPPALQETFNHVKEDFMLNLESDANDLAVKRGMVKEYVAGLPIVALDAKKEIMKVLLADPSYLQWELDALVQTCRARGINPEDSQVFSDVIRALVGAGKIRLPY